MSTPPRYVSEYSRHPVPAIALGEALGGVVERIGTSPDLAVVFVSGAAARALPQITDAIHTLLCPTVLLGCTGQAIISGPKLDMASGVQIWVGNPGPVRPVRVEAGSRLPRLENREAFIGFKASQVDAPARGVAAQVWLDDTGYSDGQAGFCIANERVSVARAQGFRPVGEPLAVTGISNGQISRLAAETAEATMKGVIAGLGPEERALAVGGLSLGLVRDESSEDSGPGDFVILPLKGTSTSGCLIAQNVEHMRSRVVLGSIVRFHVPDPSLAAFDPDDLAHTKACTRGALLVATGDQPLPDMANFHDFGIEATAGLVSNTITLTPHSPDAERDRQNAHSPSLTSNGPAVVVFD